MGKISVTPRQKTPPKTRRYHLELSRSTKITKVEPNGETQEFVVSYDDLKHGDLLGRGQFGTGKADEKTTSDLCLALRNT